MATIIAEQRKAIERITDGLVIFGSHKRGCAIALDPPGVCDCGYFAALSGEMSAPRTAPNTGVSGQPAAYPGEKP